MAAANVGDFDEWLCSKLTSLDIDGDIYTSYITGILEENDEDTSKKEALTEVLGSMLDEVECENVSQELLSKWANSQDSKETNPKKDDERGIDDILAAHVEASQQQIRAKETKPTHHSNAVKQSVIAMYSSVDDEVDETSHTVAQKEQKTKTVDEALELFKNTNAASVTQAEKQERIKQKDLADKKKEKDKHDRELQKIKKNERKDKEKKRTQKKERMR